jgi:hypothetical protein
VDGAAFTFGRVGGSAAGGGAATHMILCQAHRGAAWLDCTGSDGGHSLSASAEAVGTSAVAGPPPLLPWPFMHQVCAAALCMAYGVSKQWCACRGPAVARWCRNSTRAAALNGLNT